MLRAHYDGGSGQFVEGIGSEHRRDGHAATSDHQPQRDLRRRAEAARLLPAGRQAREAPARGSQGRDFGLAQVLPRHRQRAARARGQGIGLRLRRHLQRAVRARKLCDRVRRGRRARPVRGLRLGQRRALLWPAAQRRARSRLSAPTSQVPGRRSTARAVPRRRNACAGASPARSAARAARCRSPRRNGLRAARNIRRRAA